MVDDHVEGEADHEHQRDELDRPPAMQRERKDERRHRRAEARLEAASQRVRHTRRRKPRAAYFAPAIVSAAGNAHCAATPASESVRLSSVRAGTVESGERTIQRSERLEVVVGDEPGEQRVVLKPRLKPVAQMTCSAPFGTASTRKRPSRSAAASGSSHRGPADRTAFDSSRSVDACCSSLSAWYARKPALREQRARHVQRAAERLATPDRDDLGAGGEGVQPFGRRRHAGADDRDLGRVRVRLVGVHGARVLARPGKARVPGRDEHVRERPVAVQLEAPVAGADALDAPLGEAARPAGLLAHLLGMGEEDVHAGW